MPNSTEILAQKPLPKRAMSKMVSSTMPEMPTPVRSAYLGLGMVGTMAKPLGTGARDEPGAPAAAWASASHFRCSGLGTEGAVGPTGLPKIQLMPTRIRLMPMTAMMVPVTTGGKKRSMRLIMGAIRMETTPAPITAPKIRPAPAWPPVACAIDTMGATAAKVTPIITGSLMPNHCVAPQAWISVTRPQTNRSAEIRCATCSGGRFSARPTISGTATAPAYITSTCCKPRAVRRPRGNVSSTGWTAVVMGGCLQEYGRAQGLMDVLAYARVRWQALSYGKSVYTL